MHRTLERDTLYPVAGNLKEQQKAFDLYRHDYNHDQPHESLHDRTPSDYYVKSNRPYVERPHPPEYDHDYLVRKVHHSGEIEFMSRTFYLTELLTGLPVGLKETGYGLWQLQLSFYVLSSIDLRKNKVIRN
jgi:putative transposase